MILRSLRQVVFHVSDFVQLAALDHRVVEHVDHGLAQRLGPVDSDEHRAGHVQTPFTQAHQQVGNQGRVLGRALHQGQRVLDPVDADTEGHDTAGFSEVDPVDHQRDQVQPGQILRKQLGQRGFGHRHKPAGDRRLTCRRGLFGDLLADRLKPHWVAAGRQPGQHLLHRDLPFRRTAYGYAERMLSAIGLCHRMTTGVAWTVNR